MRVSLSPIFKRLLSSVELTILLLFAVFLIGKPIEPTAPFWDWVYNWRLLFGVIVFILVWIIIANTPFSPDEED
jgi:hypothetical protein